MGKNIFKSIVEKLLDAVFPPQCISCDERISQIHSFCSLCWGKMTFISNPLCKTCGTPFPTKNEGELCIYCLDNPPSYAYARSVLKFDDNVAKLIHALKYYDQTELAPAMAKMMTRVFHNNSYSPDIISPIPLHLKRLKKRKFNQSLLLESHLAKLTDTRLVPDLIIRVKDIPSQSGLNRAQRMANVDKAFLVNSKYHKDIEYKNILLIDDVITTGATLNECALLLMKAKAKKVCGLSFARSYR